MKKDLISVVIPFFNVQNYLKYCVCSLLRQTYKNLEFIFIDDGSTDNSLDILKSFRELDDRIQIIELKKNYGPGNARNIGILHSSGEYILFVDSDDYLIKDTIFKIWKSWKEGSDICIYNGYSFSDKTGKVYSTNYFYISDDFLQNGEMTDSDKFILSTIAEELRHRFKGKIITHMHCLPWKFELLDHEETFRKLYYYDQNQEYDHFRVEEKSQVNYLPSDQIICLSKVVKNYLINVHKVKSDKIHIIYNGLEIRDSCGLTLKRRAPGEILYAGKVSKDKGIYELLDVLSEVKRRGYQFKLVIAGTCSSFEWTRILKRYNQLEIDYRGEITFEELQELYLRCTMGVIPSFHEQCSYVALEMAYHRVPMIVSKVDALAEIFTDGKNALMVPWEFDADFGLKVNREIFIEHVVRLLEEEQLRTVLGNNARKLYEEKFQLKDMVSQTVAIYQQLINQ